MEDAWFKKDYKPTLFEEKDKANLADVEAVFRDSEVSLFDYNICMMIKLFLLLFSFDKLMSVKSVIYEIGASCHGKERGEANSNECL